MELSHFCVSIRDLGSFFGKHLTEAQTEFYFKELNYITKDSFDHAVRATMKGRKPNAGNFPTIEDFQALCPRQKSDVNYNYNESEMEYYERITVDDLFKALDVLEKQGRDKFIAYCKIRHISADDIERVEWKLKYSITGGKILQKLAKERKGEK